MNKAVIVIAKRTPIGKKGGMLKNFPCEKLAAAVMKNIAEGSSLNPADIDEVILGNAVGPGGNIARLSSLAAGFPVHVPGVTIDRQCGSGLEAINLAARLIQAGAGEVFLAGGVESTSTEPVRIDQSDNRSNPRVLKRARFSPEEIGDPDMGVAAENVAEKYGISRQEQDSFALSSYQKTLKSIESSNFQDEIVPLSANEDGTNKEIWNDESPRDSTTYEKLLKRSRPVFRKNGTVTPGNSCSVNDGASIALVMSEEKAKKSGLKPILSFVDSIATGVDPNYLGIGPVPAVQKLLTRNRLTPENIDLVEFNEAFAAQVAASIKELSIPFEKVNVGGGAIAYGHPYGASGAVLVTRLGREMSSRKAKLGLTTLGIGGGIGLATLFKRYE
ncbi:thiolase family protein [Alkalihalobacillus sp. AL-G]|uniref:thiolase family protein n=1 Tax=Alkalihalobacillus sp. AL-G TaxID=2926399 RepID=UPI0027299D05|nr:thiolase family protein [Alkalihalobacillus sp. AL-G]WLD91702.1 thiolase family protein [Alkalihalobacillus sp. AL-G]